MSAGKGVCVTGPVRMILLLLVSEEVLPPLDDEEVLPPIG